MSLAMFPQKRPLQPRKTAIIVGASSGIGAALARELAQNGYYVAVLARREDQLMELCNLINSAAGDGEQATYYVHDVSNRDEIPGLFNTIARDLGGLDLLVYTAGQQFNIDPGEFDTRKDVEMAEVNLLGAIAWINEAAARFSRTGVGHIVGISSIAADRGRGQNPAYNASKAALNTYLESLRNRISRLGVQVTTIKQGFTRTKLLDNAPRTFWVISPEKAAELIYQAIRRRKQVSYVPGRWRLIGLAIVHTPSFIFRRLSF